MITKSEGTHGPQGVVSPACARPEAADVKEIRRTEAERRYPMSLSP